MALRRVWAIHSEAIVFLHGILDSWFQRHHQMATLSATHRCIGIDLKPTANPRSALGTIATKAQRNKCMPAATHRRPQIQPRHSWSQYCLSRLHRCQPPRRRSTLRPRRVAPVPLQPDLSAPGRYFPQHAVDGLMEDPKRFVLFVYAWISKIPIPDAEMARVI